MGKPLINRRGTHVDYSFDSLGDYVAYLDEVNATRPWANDPGRSSHKPEEDRHWSGTATYAEARELAIHGWKDGLKTLAPKVDDIKRADGSTLDNGSYRFSDEGMFFDVGEFLSGSPDHWLEPEPDKPRRVVSILISATYSCGVSKDEIEWRGAALCCLIDRLQEEGLIVEVVVNAGVRGLHHGIAKSMQLYVNMGTTPLDMDAVSFAITHPAFCRRLEFALTEDACDVAYCGSYGFPEDAPKEKIAAANLYMGPIHASEEKIRNLPEATKWVEDRLGKMIGHTAHHGDRE